MDQCIQKALVIPLVQPDGGLIEDIHHTDESRSNLACQTNPLRFTTRECFGASIEREIVQSYVHQKPIPGAQFLQNLIGNLALPATELQRVKVGLRIAYWKRSNLRQAPPIDVHAAGVFAQSRSLAGFTRCSRYVLGKLVPHRGRLCFPVAPIHVGNHSLENMSTLEDRATVIDIGKLYLLATVPMKNDVAVCLRELVERLVHVEAVMPR